MANITITGLDELIRDMDEMREAVTEMMEETINEGEKILVLSWKTAIKKYGHIDTKAMIGSVGPNKSTRGKYRTEVYPQGKDQKKVRNAEKAYINHYGKSSKKGTHFVDEVERDAELKIEASELKIYDSYLAKHNLN